MHKREALQTYSHAICNDEQVISVDAVNSIYRNLSIEKPSIVLKPHYFLQMGYWFDICMLCFRFIGSERTLPIKHMDILKLVLLEKKSNSIIELVM